MFLKLAREKACKLGVIQDLQKVGLLCSLLQYTVNVLIFSRRTIIVTQNLEAQAAKEAESSKLKDGERERDEGEEKTTGEVGHANSRLDSKTEAQSGEDVAYVGQQYSVWKTHKYNNSDEVFYGGMWKVKYKNEYKEE